MNSTNKKRLGTENETPTSSVDSFSGYYRDLKMSYECMVEVRKIERALGLATATIKELNDEINYTDAHVKLLQDTIRSNNEEISKLKNLSENESRIRQFYVSQTLKLKEALRLLNFGLDAFGGWLIEKKAPKQVLEEFRNCRKETK